MPVLRRAQSRGYVRDCDGDYVAQGLRHGFDLGVSEAHLLGLGTRVHRNYKSAMEAHKSVTDAITSRVAKGKSVVLGRADECLPVLLKEYDSMAVFPIGAVPKPNQAEDTRPEDLIWRPTSDHTKTGFNACKLHWLLGHSLNTYKEVEWLLKRGYFCRISDVEDAFLLIPLHPRVWRFMLFRWSLGGPDAPQDLLMHLFGDFGTRGMPGTFQFFLVRVVIQMARSEFVLVLPMVVYVDDANLIGPDAHEADCEMERFQVWSHDVCGVPWKVQKDRLAAIPQYYIGFWWDSIARTRTLDESKLGKYLHDLAEAADARSPMIRLPRQRQPARTLTLLGCRKGGPRVSMSLRGGAVISRLWVLRARWPAVAVRRGGVRFRRVRTMPAARPTFRCGWMWLMIVMVPMASLLVAPRLLFCLILLLLLCHRVLHLGVASHLCPLRAVFRVRRGRWCVTRRLELCLLAPRTTILKLRTPGVAIQIEWLSPSTVSTPACTFFLRPRLVGADGWSFFSTHLAYTVSPASTVVQWITLPREVLGVSLAAYVSVSFHLTGLLPQTILSVDTSRMGQRVLCACVGQGSGPC